jgi:hypothetical protein
MNMKFLLPLAVVAGLGMATSANALTITPEPGANLVAFSFSVAGDVITIRETWGPGTSSDVVLRFDDFDFGRDSFIVEKYVTNNTGVAFAAFSNELLQSNMGGSNDFDGLSFAQFGVPERPRSSDSFTTVTADEVADRDFLNFTDGSVADGSTVFMTFGLTNRRDTAETNPFFLRQMASEIAVPEPATWAMLISGFGLVGFSMRRRRAALGSVTA